MREPFAFVFHEPASNFRVTEIRPKLRPLTGEFLPFLQLVLQLTPHLDPYACSAAYHAITGRKGLWYYGTGHSGLIVAQHPNLADTLLAFPPFGARPGVLLQSLLADPCFAGRQIVLARVSEPMLAQLRREIPDIDRRVVEEAVLDWRYPCHVLSTERICTHQGGALKNFRQHIRRAELAGLCARNLDPQLDAATLQGLLQTWAVQYSNRRPHDEIDTVTLTEAARTALSLMEHREIPLAGVIVWQGNRPLAFRVWEETDPARGLANSLISAALAQIHGTAEFACLAMCEALHARGFSEVCIGGSEEAGLDAFKRKLCPTNSIPLATVVLRSAPHTVRRAGRTPPPVDSTPIPRAMQPDRNTVCV